MIQAQIQEIRLRIGLGLWIELRIRVKNRDRVRVRVVGWFFVGPGFDREPDKHRIYSSGPNKILQFFKIVEYLSHYEVNITSKFKCASCLLANYNATSKLEKCEETDLHEKFFQNLIKKSLTTEKTFCHSAILSAGKN